MTMRDLSHPIESGMQVYPDDPDVAVAPHAEFGSDGYRVSSLHLGSHSGTHVDAPSHTEADGRSLSAFPIETFRFDARLVDCRDLGPREPIAADRVPDDDAELLVLRTGFDARWGTDAYLDHPYLTRAAAERCVERGYHVAIDALNVDPTPSPNATAAEPEDFGAHHALLGADRLIVENLTNLAALPERFTLHAYPLALGAAEPDRSEDGAVPPGGDGAPVRAVAEFRE